MHFTILRAGQTYGPYTLEDLERYLASGNILPTDLAQSEAMTEPRPVADLFPPPPPAGPSPVVPSSATSSVPPSAFSTEPSGGGAVLADPPLPAQPGSAQAFAAQGYVAQAFARPPMVSAYRDAPNLHWGLVLLFTFLTNGLFLLVWNFIIMAWLRRVQPNAKALFYYIWAHVLLLVFFLALVVASVFALGRDKDTITTILFTLLWGAGLLAAFVLLLVARFSERASLEEHFNGPEPIGLKLSGIMTFFFEGIYFQYHLNRMNAVKEATRLGLPRPF